MPVTNPTSIYQEFFVFFSLHKSSFYLHCDLFINPVSICTIKWIHQSNSYLHYGFSTTLPATCAIKQYHQSNLNFNQNIFIVRQLCVQLWCHLLWNFLPPFHSTATAYLAFHQLQSLILLPFSCNRLFLFPSAATAYLTSFSCNRLFLFPSAATAYLTSFNCNGRLHIQFMWYKNWTQPNRQSYKH